MKKILLVLVLIVILARCSFGYITVLTDTNGVLMGPTNFFSTNIVKLTNALAQVGYASGDPLGAAAAAVAQATNASPSFVITNITSGNIAPLAPGTLNINMGAGALTGGSVSVGTITGNGNNITSLNPANLTGTIPLSVMPFTNHYLPFQTYATLSTNPFPNLCSPWPQYAFSKTFGNTVNSPATVRQYAFGAYLINEDKDTSKGNQYIFVCFANPPNAPNVTLKLSCAADATASDYIIGLTDQGYGNQSTTNVPISTTGTNFSFSHAAVDQQAFVIQCTDGARQLMVSKLSLTFQPAPTNIGMTNAFYRYETTRRQLRTYSDTPQWGYSPFYSPYEDTMLGGITSVRMRTSAPALTFEIYQNAANANLVYYAYVDGVLKQTYSSLGKYYQLFDLSLDGNEHQVEFVQAYPTGYSGLLRAVYCGQQYPFTFMNDNTPSSLGIFVYGDSIMCSINENSDYNRTTKAIIEQLTGADVTYHCQGGASFYVDYTNGTTRQIYREVARAQPAYFWSAMLFNDWNGGLWGNTNNFATNVAIIIDNIHKVSPATLCFIQLGITEGGNNETYSNANGNSIAQYRNALSLLTNGVNAYTGDARTNYTVIVPQSSINGNGLNVSGDNIHPTSAGSAQLGNRISRTLFNYWYK